MLPRRVRASLPWEVSALSFVPFFPRFLGPGIVPGSARRARGSARSRALQMLHVVLSAVSLFKTFGFDQHVRRCGTAQTGV